MGLLDPEYSKPRELAKVKNIRSLFGHGAPRGGYAPPVVPPRTGGRVFSNGRNQSKPTSPAGFRPTGGGAPREDSPSIFNQRGVTGEDVMNSITKAFTPQEGSALDKSIAPGDRIGLRESQTPEVQQYEKTPFAERAAEELLYSEAPTGIRQPEVPTTITNEGRGTQGESLQVTPYGDDPVMDQSRKIEGQLGEIDKFLADNPTRTGSKIDQLKSLRKQLAADNLPLKRGAGFLRGGTDKYEFGPDGREITGGAGGQGVRRNAGGPMYQFTGTAEDAAKFSEAPEYRGATFEERGFGAGSGRTAGGFGARNTQVPEQGRISAKNREALRLREAELAVRKEDLRYRRDSDAAASASVTERQELRDQQAQADRNIKSKATADKSAKAAQALKVKNAEGEHDLLVEQLQNTFDEEGRAAIQAQIQASAKRLQQLYSGGAATAAPGSVAYKALSAEKQATIRRQFGTRTDVTDAEIQEAIKNLK